MSRHLRVMHELTGGCVWQVLGNTGTGRSRDEPISGKFLVSGVEKGVFSAHSPSAPEHCFRESSQIGTDREMSAVLDHLESATIAVFFPVLIPGSCARTVFFFVSFRERTVLFRASFLVLISGAVPREE